MQFPKQCEGCLDGKIPYLATSLSIGLRAACQDWQPRSDDVHSLIKEVCGMNCPKISIQHSKGEKQAWAHYNKQLTEEQHGKHEQLNADSPKLTEQPSGHHMSFPRLYRFVIQKTPQCRRMHAGRERPGSLTVIDGCGKNSSWDSHLLEPDPVHI